MKILSIIKRAITKNKVDKLTEKTFDVLSTYLAMYSIQLDGMAEVVRDQELRDITKREITKLVNSEKGTEAIQKSMAAFKAISELAPELEESGANIGKRIEKIAVDHITAFENGLKDVEKKMKALSEEFSEEESTLQEAPKDNNSH